MTYEIAVLLLVVLFPFVAWPLIQGRVERARHRATPSDRTSELREEIDLDLATGRLTEEEARRRRALVEP